MHCIGHHCLGANMHTYPSLFQHFVFMKPQNTWVTSPTLLHKGESVRASKDTSGSSWATCSSIWQYSELNSYSLVFKGNSLYIIHPFAEHQWEESEYIFFTSAHETFMNIGENLARLPLLRVKQSRLSQPLILSDAPIPETSLRAFSAFTQCSCVCLVLGTPKMDPEPQMWSHNCSTEEEDHLLQPAVPTFRTTAPAWFMGTFAHAQLVQQEWCPSLLSCFPDGQPHHSDYLNQFKFRVFKPACFSAQCRIWHFPLLNILSFLSVHFSRLSRCPE